MYRVILLFSCFETDTVLFKNLRKFYMLYELDPYLIIFILLGNKTRKFLVKNSFVLHIKYFIT